MINHSKGYRIPALVCLSLVVSLSQFASGQGELRLSNESALALLQSNVGKWIGTRTEYQPDSTATKSKVVVVNRMEAGKWLYFQVAENVGAETKLTKGTLEFARDSGTFTRRWFESGNAEIKRSEVTFDSESNELEYSFVRPGPPAPSIGNFESLDSSQDERVTVVTTMPDKTTCVVKTFVQNDVDNSQQGKLVSELVLELESKANKSSTAQKSNESGKRKSESSDAEDSAKVTHVLRVTVFVGPMRLQEGQKPELTISPDEGIKIQRTGNDTFEFTGLKPGEAYTVNGTYKLTTGLGVSTKGETSAWETPTDQRKTIATRVLRLDQ